MKKLNHSRFLSQISSFLPYSPDSANYSLYESFIDILLSDGGDDDFASQNTYTIAFKLSKQVTLKHIEQYDNDIDPLDIYLNIKPSIL